ncbi:NAD(P)H-dependent oxidoreductase [Thalassobellus suaedae]|uniref:NAD(P)H-dependent oxidoreductase n=1 Tax=Thalassobellus suaedae TaxID=3074124 RepID=A0ABY9XXD8_9FLAO|nr:NAD(P)H-dependent oxidoreductase [Flavobacteriaceae bacterium HL-DH14]
MSIIKQLHWRYATKKFDVTKKLSVEKLDILKQAFNLTATSFGLQTIKMIVLENKDLRASLVAHSYHQKQVLEASHVLIICIQDNILEQDIIAYYNNIKSLRSTSETILKPYRESLVKTIEKMSVEERLQWSKNQAYIALGNLMTVCAIEGIDACPMEGFVNSKYDEILQLDKIGLKSILLLPVGYRAEDDMFSEFKKVRKSLEDTIIDM